MRYKDEFHIASTAVLLSMAMFGISVVVPKESRVPTAKTTLTVLTIAARTILLMTAAR